MESLEISPWESQDRKENQNIFKLFHKPLPTIQQSKDFQYRFFETSFKNLNQNFLKKNKLNLQHARKKKQSFLTFVDNNSIKNHDCLQKKYFRSPFEPTQMSIQRKQIQLRYSQKLDLPSTQIQDYQAFQRYCVDPKIRMKKENFRRWNKKIENRNLEIIKKEDPLIQTSLRHSSILNHDQGQIIKKKYPKQNEKAQKLLNILNKRYQLQGSSISDQKFRKYTSYFDDTRQKHNQFAINMKQPQKLSAFNQNLQRKNLNTMKLRKLSYEDFEYLNQKNQKQAVCFKPKPKTKNNENQLQKYNLFGLRNTKKRLT